MERADGKAFIKFSPLDFFLAATTRHFIPGIQVQTATDQQHPVTVCIECLGPISFADESTKKAVLKQLRVEYWRRDFTCPHMHSNTVISNVPGRKYSKKRYLCVHLQAMDVAVNRSPKAGSARFIGEAA